MRTKETRSEKEKVEYTDLNKTVKKKRRQRSRKKETDQVETMLQSGGQPKQIYKGGQKKTICEMKNEGKESQTDRNEILKIFYTELCRSTLQDQHTSLKNTSPDS